MSSQTPPLLAGQASIWAAEQFGALGRPYNARWSLTYERGAATDRTVLQAVDALIGIHPALSLRIVSERGVPYQAVDRPASSALVVCDETDSSGTDTLRRLAGDLAHKPLDLEADPLSEFHVVSAAEQIHVLVLQHHLAMDGGARSLLASDLDQLVRGATPPKSDDFAEAVGASYHLQTEATAHSDAALERLGELGKIGLPEHEDKSGHGAIHDMLSVDGSGGTQSVTGGTAALVVASVAGLAPYLPAERFLMAVTASTRPTADSRVAGCFVNTIAIPASVDFTTDRAGVAEAKASISAAAATRHLPSQELAATARRLKLQLPPPQRVIATATAAIEIPGFAAYAFVGARSGLTFRTWQLASGTMISLEHPDSILHDHEAEAVFSRFREALIQLRPC